MTTYYPGAGRTELGDQAALDLAAWAKLLPEVLAHVGHTPAAADLVCSSEAGDRVADSLTALADLGGPISVDQLRERLPILIRPLLGDQAGYPRLTDLLAAAAELIARADAAWAINLALNSTTESIQVGGNVGAHLQFAASVLRQAHHLIESPASTSSRNPLSTKGMS
ncbi:hypothetical protein [Nocardia sp. NPDC051832]|uniref:hypothetical protein n=1 Tax=Nocardia sp. NPDC051832 TaxID=3155673 RepID=UPI0034243FF8